MSFILIAVRKRWLLILLPPPPLLILLPFQAFAGEVSVIQELPEWQDIDNIWGTGFMLSINLKQTFSVSNFNLDIMILKNTCATSLGHIKNCTPLSPAIDPTEQKLIGLEGSQPEYGAIYHSRS